MRYKILSKKSQENDRTEVLRSIRKFCNYNLKEALEVHKSLEVSYEFDDDLLAFALSKFYEIRDAEKEKRDQLNKGFFYTEIEKQAALRWFQNLSNKEKAWVEILKHERPAFTGPFA